MPIPKAPAKLMQRVIAKRPPALGPGKPSSWSISRWDGYYPENIERAQKRLAATTSASGYRGLPPWGGARPIDNAPNIPNLAELELKKLDEMRAEIRAPHLAPARVPQAIYGMSERAFNHAVAKKTTHGSYHHVHGARMPKGFKPKKSSKPMATAVAQLEPEYWKTAAMWGAGIGAGIGYMRTEEGAGVTGTLYGMGMGAIGGAALAGGATAFGGKLLKGLSEGISANKPFKGSWEPWNETLSGAALSGANFMNTAGGRAALIGGGSLLGGTFMGGYRNKRRGFNSNRGSRI